MIFDPLKPTIGNALLEAAGFERKAADIYAAFSMGFSRYPHVSEFWDGMHHDELVHQWVLQQTYERLPVAHLDQPVSSELTQAIQATHEILTGLARVKVENLDEAYQLARKLEASEVNSVFRLMLQNIVPESLQENFASTQLDVHQYKVFDFQLKFGDSEVRKKIAFMRD